ncbi:hypothetical protein EIP91_001400 [Steccherinum ochraceum]|uniref:Actin cytoskeleton-regulatory complex protein pan1 n=1 Tax=Steccherinum ochraceum TaxID=92696 RepID=A0A4R0RMJ5_9APHY|nr:hypothetical protein EIP91_001400 [Steccherinum ochraceum]
MGLIYRRLNGNDLPDELPEELIPPSHRDLDTSVNFLKDILRNDTRARSPGFDSGPVSKLKERSFNSSSAPGAGGRQDATVYKYTDDSPPGGFYQPRSRHVDRSAVRTTSESNSPSADLDDMKRQLEKTAQMLDRSAAESASRTAEDDELEREMSDVRYRIKRVQEDLDYVSRGPRSSAKDEDRRRLERELLNLMHERVPELERKMADREAKRKREQREWDRDRDRRNDRFGRYDDRDRDRDTYSSSRYDRDDRDRDYRSYDRDRDRDRDDRDKDRDYEIFDRPRTPPAARSPPPPPPSAPPPNNVSRLPPPAPAPSASPAANMKSMTPEERKAFIQAEAQRRMQERMAALGVSTPAPSSKLDTSVEDRLAKEKKEAEEKAKAAEKQAEDRERMRRERLENEKALKDGSTPTTPITSPPAVAPPAAAPPAPKPTPPAPKPRAPAPPPPRKAPAIKPPVATRIPAAPPAPPVQIAPPVAAPPPPAPPAVPEVDPEEEAFRVREAALRKAREERMERLRRMEREEEEAAKRLEEEYQQRRQQLQAQQAQAERARTPVPAPAPVAPAPPPAPPVTSPPVRAATPPPPPPAPAPPVASPPASDKAKTNPFSRMMAEGSSPAATVSTPTANGSTNPFFKNQAPAAVTPPVRTSSIPPPSKSPAPPAVKTSYHTAPADSEDDWDEIKEKDDDDDSEDELDSSRDTRNKLAQQLFGNILPPSRPQSAAPAGGLGGSSEPSTPSIPAPPPPPPSAPPTIAPAAPNAPPPPPPMAPVAPPPPAAAIAAPAPTGDRGALLGAIQAGARLKKVQTNDRSSAPISGKVLGDTAPPPHINAAAPSAPSPPQPPLDLPPLAGAADSSRSSNRESVDWYAGLAADGGASQHSQEYMPSMAEEDEEIAKAPVPAIQVEDTADPLEDVDQSVSYRVRSLYAYEGQRPEDLTFSENVMIVANPSKSGGDWWYGKVVRDGKAGFFPNTYVEKIQAAQAKALYDYTGNNPDELPFQEGDTLAIVDRTDADWWKAEKEGMVFIVPAAYLEAVEVSPTTPRPQTLDTPTSAITVSLPTANRVGQPSLAVPERLFNDQSDSDTDSDSEDDEDDYDTADESMDSDDELDEMTEEQRKAEREVRAVERQRVLEAAGLIIKSKSDNRRKPPARPIRSRSFRKRRAPPAIPLSASVSHDAASTKELPTLPPEPEAEPSFRLDDAYERYEAYKKSNANMNRLSTASLDTDLSQGSPQPPSTVPQSPALSTSESESLTHSLLHFFGRSRTPGIEGEGKARPIISAPILQKDPTQDNGRPQSQPGEQEFGFGSSWASLVDKSALAEIPTAERKRQEAIFEFIATEAAYVRDLQLIVEVFYSNLLSIMDEKAVTVVFANVEDILLTNTTFLSSLEERQKDCRLYIDKIGDLLKGNMAHMGVYMDYCVNQANAAKVLQSLRQANPELAARLQQLRDDPSVRNLDLSSYLLVPMQRITRYPLLIKQILHYTESSEDRRCIERALEMAEKVLNHINETIREQEDRERLKVISRDLWIGQGRLDLTEPTRHMGARKLLKEGVLMKAKSGRRLRAFLCSDILVLTEEAAKTLYRMPIPLSECQVREAPGHRDDLLFQVALAYPRGGDVISLRGTSARDCQQWMQAIDNASRKCREAQKRAARRSMRG